MSQARLNQAELSLSRWHNVLSYADPSRAELNCAYLCGILS